MIRRSIAALALLLAFLAAPVSAQTLTHSKVDIHDDCIVGRRLTNSAISCTPSATDFNCCSTEMLKPSDWNANHIVTGGTDGDVLCRDSTQTSGWNWCTASGATPTPTPTGTPATPTPTPTPGSGAAKMQFIVRGLGGLPTGTTAKIAALSGASATIDGALSDNCDTTYFSRIVMSGTFKNLYCSLRSSISSGSVTVSLGDGNCTTANTALILTLDSTHQNASDTSNTVAVTAGTIRSLVFTPSSPTYGGNGWTCSVEFDPS